MAHPHDVHLRSESDPNGDDPRDDPRDGDLAAGIRSHLAHCWRLDCDIDPLILRMRVLRRRGAWGLVVCLEQELLPLF
jgi:hypothetical protein